MTTPDYDAHAEVLGPNGTFAERVAAVAGGSSAEDATVDGADFGYLSTDIDDVQEALEAADAALGDLAGDVSGIVSSSFTAVFQPTNDTPGAYPSYNNSDLVVPLEAGKKYIVRGVFACSTLGHTSPGFIVNVTAPATVTYQGAARGMGAAGSPNGGHFSTVYAASQTAVIGSYLLPDTPGVIAFDMYVNAVAGGNLVFASAIDSSPGTVLLAGSFIEYAELPA